MTLYRQDHKIVVNFRWRVMPPRRGFALVVTLSLMILLTVIAVGLLSLSAISMRSSSQGSAQAEARANARLALMIAIGELQKEMGPDMRISVESALFDSDKDTEAIDDVKQSRWLASYNAWGDWLNASYTPPDGTPLKISDTYTPSATTAGYAPKRQKMFRRWLLSMPVGQEKDINAPNSSASWDNTNSVVLVGLGSLGIDPAKPKPGDALDKVTRAYLTSVGKTGKYAWWIGPENHKARIDMAKEPPRTPDTAVAWETSQGDTAEVGVGVLEGFEALDSNKTLGDKLITTQTLRPADIAGDKVQQHFFDLTASSRGVLASVRTGRLKKDLSLLFEKPKADLPDGKLPDDLVNYRFSAGDVREPSIRPMSAEIEGKPVLKDSSGKATRHFASWTRMRHFYRMYRQDSDAEARKEADGGTGDTPGLSWSGSKPSADCNVSISWAQWGAKDTYLRFPVLTSVTYILSLRTAPSNNGSIELRTVTTPVYVYWNPYNVELRVPDKKLGNNSSPIEATPLNGQLYLNGIRQGSPGLLALSQGNTGITSGSGAEIIFKPGEFRIFCSKRANLVEGNSSVMFASPEFDPLYYGGVSDNRTSWVSTPEAQKPGLEITFTSQARDGVNSLFNSRYGNTPGSFVNRGFWAPTADPSTSAQRIILPFTQHVDWFSTLAEQNLAQINSQTPWVFSDTEPHAVGYLQLAMKSNFLHTYGTIGWAKDWRCRNWIQAPPFYLGKGLYMSENPTIGHTQRIDCPVEMRFGALASIGKRPDDIIESDGINAILSPDEQISAIPSLELPSVPIASLAGFSGMRIDPGWFDVANPDVVASPDLDWNVGLVSPSNKNTSGNSMYNAQSKAMAYQSGVTGPGIGNSFLHPMIPRNDVYYRLDNSKSMEPLNMYNLAEGYKSPPTDTEAYSDYWDHVLLLNDALWDDYFVSSLADQKRGDPSVGESLANNLERLIDPKKLPDPEKLISNSRYRYYSGGMAPDTVTADLEAADGYLKASAHLMVEGMFNVNSTSVEAWHALFAGIRERQLVYRDANGVLKPVQVPKDKRIALSRFNTATTNEEALDPEQGFKRADGLNAWSDVRFLDNAQLRKLAEECVKQVKLRGPFLNFSEFINRRLSNDALGIMGALQSAIDYDDFDDPADPGQPDPASINYAFKSDPYMLKASDLGTTSFATPEAAVGSRYAGIPGYVIQSDLLKPIANTLSVRDDTFRIRAYGDSRDPSGKIVARAWCEAVVQRLPEYQDPTDEPEVPARKMDANGNFSDNTAVSDTNRRFGRKFQIESFRWLSGSEI